MAKIPFTASARTAKLIGLENFANAEGAIIELVKNTYDADASTCLIIFETSNNRIDSLYIIDNGSGMHPDVIREKWMMIGTDDKLVDYESELGRVKTGAKGIGRFALNRLGSVCELTTVSKDHSLASRWFVDWSDFDKAGITLNQVYAELDSLTDFNFFNYLERVFDEETKRIHRVFNQNDFSSGTILHITNLNDEWDLDRINSLFKNLELLIPPLEQPDFSIYLFDLNSPEEFGKVADAYYDDYDYKIDATYTGNPERELVVRIQRNELDIGLIKKHYSEIFNYEALQKDPYRREDFEKDEIVHKVKIDSIRGFDHVDESLLDDVGSFKFIFYFMKNTISDKKSEGDRRTYPYKNFSSSNRKAWLGKFGGVKIYRDDFRVRPYGENGEDWLKLGERESRSPGGAGQKMGGYRISPNQIAGTVKISRITNSAFQDKSGREGIQENDTFFLFRNILVEIISFFERDRNTIMFSLRQLARKRYKDEEAKRKAKEEAERILREKEAAEAAKKKGKEGSESGPTERELLLAQATKAYEQEIEDKDEEIRLLRSLSSVGLIIASFTHELKSLRSRLIPRTDHLVKVLKRHIEPRLLKDVKDIENPFRMIQSIKEEDIKLKHWLDYSLSALRQDRRKRKNLDFKEYFENFKINWDKALRQRKVELRLKQIGKEKCVIRAFPVDMDTIFNNLLANSLDSLKKLRGQSKIVEVSWEKVSGYVEIHFRDNGLGLDPDYIENPNQIFNAFETSKRDKKGEKIGTGLGLYLVKTIVDEHNDAMIDIIPRSDGFEIKLSFPIRTRTAKPKQ